MSDMGGMSREDYTLLSNLRAGAIALDRKPDMASKARASLMRQAERRLRELVK